MSRDLENWTVYTSLAAERPHRIVFREDIFFALSLYGVVAASTNGVDWNMLFQGHRSIFKGVAYGNGVFVAVGSRDHYAGPSQTSIVWSEDGRLPGERMRDMVFARGKLVGVGDFGLLGEAAFFSTLQMIVRLGTRALQISAPSGVRVVVEASENLQDWRTLGAFTNAATELQRTLDLNTSLAPQFFRTRLDE